MFNTECCCITKEGAKQIAEIEQLEELVLDESAAKTNATYRSIFKNMKNLKQLEML